MASRRAAVLLSLPLVVGCGVARSSPGPVTEPPQAAAVLFDCTALEACRPDLGVCLRCTSPDNPEWVWSEAPGGPQTYATTPRLLSMPSPHLQQDCCFGDPFDAVPDCTRFEFDERGFPLRTRPAAQREPRYRFTYEGGRFVSSEVDELAWCDSIEGDQVSCGAPDGVFDRTVMAIRWEGLRAAAGPNEWLFDTRGRLLAWRDSGEGSGRNTFTGDRLTEQAVVNGSDSFMTRLHYDDAGQVVLAERASASATFELRWEYDAHGWTTRRVLPSGVTEYDNTYDAEGRLVRRTERSALGSQPVTLRRRHDALGLVVEEAAEVNGATVTTRQWERDEAGVPLSVVRHGERLDQRCFRHLASPPQ